MSDSRCSLSSEDVKADSPGEQSTAEMNGSDDGKKNEE
jgi:hypothetical protein